MGDLLLKNLEIRSFRGFRHLKIEHLGRVNLIVGKNNVGKSALLEALRLYASKASPEVIWELLGVRGESRRSNLLSAPEKELSALKYLFYGRRDLKPNLEPIQIGPINSVGERLTLSIGWYTERVSLPGWMAQESVTPEEYDTAGSLIPFFILQIGEEEKFTDSLRPPLLKRPHYRQVLKEIKHTYKPASGLDNGQVGKLWDSIALTDLEIEILAALRVIAPGVERINLVADPASPGERVPIVKVQGIEEPLPLSNLGDGMQRMLGIALALVNAKDGMLLIDEIENGLHYSVLPSLWRIIFQLAQRLHVQVFATSHSRDCIEAFQRIAEADKQTEGMLIRLETKKGEIVATLFDERELHIATREQIEVR